MRDHICEVGNLSHSTFSWMTLAFSVKVVGSHFQHPK